MGANGSFISGKLETEEGKKYKTVYVTPSGVKIVEKKGGGTVKLPEESHSANAVYATFYADGHDLKAIAVYGSNHQKLYEIHTIDHKGIGMHYHKWKDGRPISVHALADEMKKLVNNIRNLK